MKFHQKAEWHAEINDGEIPVLELPNGKLISDPKLMIDLAAKIGGNKGLSIRPYE
jgi:hypothetical protein